ncbi:MAG: tetratricopeptide repeat protein [Blastocatellia bacterium]
MSSHTSRRAFAPLRLCEHLFEPSKTIAQRRKGAKPELGFALALVVVVLSAGGCASTSPAADSTAQPLPPASPIAADDAASDGAIRFLEDKAREDPHDFIARNKLVGYYLQKVRETGSVAYLELAGRAARESLASVPAELNVGGLAALTHVEFASHEFESARQHAEQWRSFEPESIAPLVMLFDVQLELGSYEAAAVTIRTIEQRAISSDGAAFDVATRQARLAMLRGEHDRARRAYESALAAAVQLDPAPRETIAWCHWQLGETAFARGDYEAAERHADDSLVVYPGYFRALASRARALAARGDLAGAIAGYEHVSRIVPDPAFIAALGDCYAAAGRDSDAAAQYALVEQIGRLSALNGVLYNRQLAIFRADHDRSVEQAYEDASKEYSVRRDVYGADALAWTALKSGRIAEAQAAIRDALRFGTDDARMLYHAGEIALAAGDADVSRTYFEQALSLSPAFDPLAAPRIRERLRAMGA